MSQARLGSAINGRVHPLNLTVMRTRDGPSSHQILASWADSHPQSLDRSQFLSESHGQLVFCDSTKVIGKAGHLRAS